jgi:hypothetical protein
MPPRARVQAARSRTAYRFDLLDDDDSRPAFALGPSILHTGGSAAAAAAALPAALFAPRPPQAPALGLQASFADLAQELQSVSAAGPAEGSSSGGGGGSSSSSSSNWDMSAFSGGGGGGGAAAPAAPLLPGLGYRKHLVLDALHRAHGSEASAVAEKLHRQELSTRRRGRLLTSIVSGEAYRGRSAAKGMKKLAARKRLRQVRGQK